MTDRAPPPAPVHRRLRELRDATRHVGLLDDERATGSACVERARAAFGAEAVLVARERAESHPWPACACSDGTPLQSLPPLTDPRVDRHCIVGAGAAIEIGELGEPSAAARQRYGEHGFAPLEVGAEVVGLLGVGRPAADLSALELELLCSLASVTAVALAQSRERHRAVREERRRARLSRYFSPQVTEQLLADESGELAAGVRLVATVLFCDIRGFTAFAEPREPREVLEFLNRYFQEMISVVLGAGGMVDKLMGDGLLAVFGAPLARPDHAAAAAACALRLVERAARIPLDREGGGTVRVGVGLHSGPVILGDVGGGGMSDFTVLGSTVNLASRIEALTKKLGAEILLSEACHALLAGRAQVQAMAPADVPGCSEPVQTYRLVAIERG